MQKVLITGNAGYLGSVLTQYFLENGFAVLGIDNLIYGNESVRGIQGELGHKNFTFYKTDCRDIPGFTKLIAQADIIIPLAALVGAPICNKNPADAESINFQAIKDLLAVLSPSQRVIYPNSNSGYGKSLKDEPCTEESIIAPVSLYGQTKVRAEEEVLNRENSVSFRLATVFGTSARMRFDLLVNSMFAELYYNKKIVLYEGNFRRNAVHIRDVARAFGYASIFQHKYNSVYNLGLPEANLTKLEFANKIVSFLKNGAVIEGGAGRDEDQRDYIVSNEKLLATGFSFLYDLEWGLWELKTLCQCMTKEHTAVMRNY